MGDEIVDLKDVLERVQDDKELLLELFDIYQEDFVAKRGALEEALKSQDLVKIKEIAHSMKGSSGNISAKPIYANCLAIEQMAKNNNMAGISEILVKVDVQFEQLKAFAAKFKKDCGG